MIRRLLAAAALLAATACDPTPYGELRRSDAGVPAPPYGLLVGVAVAARTPSTPPLALGSSGTFFKYSQFDGGMGQVAVTYQTGSVSVGLETYVAMEDGLQVMLRPFVLRLPARRGEFYEFGTWKQMTKERMEYQTVTNIVTNKREWKAVTVSESYIADSTSLVPDARFEVEAGKVRYIGRIGMVVRGYEGSLFAGAKGEPCAGRWEHVVAKWLCIVGRENFLASEPAADLAMIRQRYPNLAGVDIEIRPLEVRPGSWPGLAEAARKLETRP